METLARVNLIKDRLRFSSGHIANANTSSRLLKYFRRRRSTSFGVKPPRKPEPVGSRDFHETESLGEEIEVQ